MSWRGPRSFLKSPYHYDALFGLRTHIQDMFWQRGNLIRNCDADTLLIGQREVEIAAVLKNPQTELMPDKKLQTPSNTSTTLDIMV